MKLLHQLIDDGLRGRLPIPASPNDPSVADAMDVLIEAVSLPMFTAVHATPVFNWITTKAGAGRPIAYDPSEAACIRQPTPATWVEFDTRAVDAEGEWSQIGLLCIEAEHPSEPGRTTYGDIYRGRPHTPPYRLGTVNWHCATMGELGGGPTALNPPPPASQASDWNNVADLAAIVVLQTLDLLHVKGIHAQEPRELGAKWRSRFERNHGFAPVTFKTLMVEAGKSPSVGGVGGTQSLVPLTAEHLVRATIADYRNGPGLFGKYKRKVYRPAHMRGSSKVGRVVKDYSIKPPTDQTERDSA